MAVQERLWDFIVHLRAAMQVERDKYVKQILSWNSKWQREALWRLQLNFCVAFVPVQWSLQHVYCNLYLV